MKEKKKQSTSTSAHAMARTGTTSEQVPDIIDIDRKVLFDAVSKKLALIIDDREILEIKPNDYSCKIQVSGIPCNDGCDRTTKTFYGDFAPTPSQAVENAYNELPPRILLLSMTSITLLYCTQRRTWMRQLCA
ncbi:hypothetical protein PVAP13_1KG355410 [Panicum virgatum]|uniref:Uncharacterized protein n=1 Tax=Panicum virgatum TaxID=38727 RepID=A0A8T0XQJ3_PANVG|nr:hypothetical protein PVAP13_1KG355410 [Panicum virgatum]